MLANIYNDILKGNNLRENITELKASLKDDASLRAFRYMLAGDYSGLLNILEDEEPKNRKNVALILGELKDDSLVPVLLEYYKKEEQLFVKSSYLKAMAKLEHSSVIEELKSIRDNLKNRECEESELKHIREEISLLNKLISSVELEGKHTFVGRDKRFGVILTTNGIAVESLAENFEQCRKLKTGVYIQQCDISKALTLRTYNEMLFALNSLETLGDDPVIAANAIANGNMLEILDKGHKEKFPYRFRVELRGEKNKDHERLFVKKLAGELERILIGKVVNSTSDYEIEIRLVKNKEDRWLPLMKLFTITDDRFSYRKNVLPVSIQPHNAAIMMELAKKYLTEGARVLDPFCGVGTMLIERRKSGEVATLYGIDKFGKAIDMARENAKNAGIVVNYINRDYFDFTHEHKFNEIVTNMPSQTAKYTYEDIKLLYKRFFEKSSKILSDKAYIFMFSDEKSLVQSNVDASKEYSIREEFCISKKDERYIFVIEKAV